MFGPHVWGWDLLRSVAMLLAAVIVITAAVIASNGRFPRNQIIRSTGAAVIAIALIGGYLARLGTIPNPGWTLIVITLGAAALAVGNIQLLQRR